MPSKASKFFNGVGRSIGRGASSLVNEAGKATGKVLGGAIGAGIVDIAPLALTAFKTGGLIKAPKGKPVKILAHGGEYVLPMNAKPTVAQKKIVANNKRKAKK